MNREIVMWEGEKTHKVTHSLELDTTSHTTGCARFFYFTFIRFGEDPDGVVGVAEYPEVVSAYVG